MLVSIAHAADGGNSVYSQSGTWMFFVAGAILALATFVTIFKKYEISNGQALLLALAALLIMLPVVSSFEWSNNSLKFVAREDAGKLSDQIAKLITDRDKSLKDISDLTAVAAYGRRRLDAIETALKANPGVSLPSLSHPTNEFGATFFEDLTKSNNSAILSNQELLRDVERLRGELSVGASK